MNEFTKQVEVQLQDILNKPFDLKSLLNSMSKIGYSFYSTEHKIGNFMIKVFRSGGFFNGGSILLNEETKEFIFLSDYKDKKTGPTYFIFSNSEKSKKIMESLTEQFTGKTVIPEDSFLKSRAFSVLKHRITPFVKERRLSISSKSLNLLMIYAFSKLESSTYDSLPAGYTKYLEEKCFRELKFVRENDRNNINLKNKYLDLVNVNQFFIYRMIEKTISSKKYRYMIKTYGIRLLFLIEALYLKKINETFTA